MRAAGRGDRFFYVGLAILLAAAAAVRTAYALHAAPEPAFLDDDTFFHLTGGQLADGKGYVQPLPLTFRGESNPTAEHPPGYPVLLSLLGRVAGSEVDTQRMVGVLAGTLTVLAVALIARRLAGPRAGLTAGLLCAAYPSFIAADGALMSESLFGMLVAFSLLQTLRLRDHWTTQGGVLLGVLVGLATLTRTEAALLVLMLALALFWRTPTRAAGAGHAMVVVLAAALVVTPWVGRNWHVFGQPVFTNNAGTTLAGANCARSYRDDVGGWSIACVDSAGRGLPRKLDEAERSARLREIGLDYAREHAGRALVVAGVRLGRVWGVLQPRQQVNVSGRRRGIQKAGVAMYYALLVAAAFGVARLRARPGDLLVLATPVLVASVAGLLTWGLVRLRHEGEVSILVLAGVGLSGILARLGRC